MPSLPQPTKGFVDFRYEESRLLHTHCTPFCFVQRVHAATIPNTDMCIAHDDSVIRVENSETGFQEALAWIKMRHYMKPELNRTIDHRLFSAYTITTDVQQAYGSLGMSGSYVPGITTFTGKITIMVRSRTAYYADDGVWQQIALPRQQQLLFLVRAYGDYIAEVRITDVNLNTVFPPNMVISVELRGDTYRGK